LCVGAGRGLRGLTISVTRRSIAKFSLLVGLSLLCFVLGYSVARAIHSWAEERYLILRSGQIELTKGQLHLVKRLSQNVRAVKALNETLTLMEAERKEEYRRLAEYYYALHDYYSAWLAFYEDIADMFRAYGEPVPTDLLMIIHAYRKCAVRAKKLAEFYEARSK